MKLLLFEIKKMFHTKTFTIFILLTVLFISGLYIKNYMQQDKIITNKVEQFSEHRSKVLIDIQQYRQELELASNPETEKKLEVAKNLYDEITELIEAIEDKNWETELQTEIKVYQTAMEYKDIEGKFNINRNDMLDTITLNEELLKVGLAKEDFDLSIQPSIFMKKIVSLLLNPIGFLILLLIFSTSITKEFEDKNIQMIYALPISKSRYILNKFISFSILGLSWLLIVFFLSFIAPYLFTENTKNSFSYPITSLEGNFISSTHYLKEAIVYSLFYLLFSVAILIFFGYLIRNTLITFLLMLFLHVGNFIILINDFIYKVNPLSYAMIDLVILTDEYQLIFGTSLLFTVTILLMTLSIYLNKRRGIH